MAEKVNVKVLKEEFNLSEPDDWVVKKSVKTIESRGYNRTVDSWCIKNTKTGAVYYEDECKYLRSLLVLAANSDSYRGKLTGKELVKNIFDNSRYMDSVRSYFNCRNYDFADKPYKGKSTSEEKLLVYYLKEHIFEYSIPNVLLRELLSLTAFKHGDVQYVNNVASRYRTRNAQAEDPYVVSRKGIHRNDNASFKKFFNKGEEKVVGVIGVREYSYYYAHEIKDYKNVEVVSNDVWSWLAVVGNGLSFHKMIGKQFFTKRESHLIMNGPDSLNLSQSIIFALAYAKSGNYSYSLTLSRLSSLAIELEKTFFGKNNRDVIINPATDYAPKIENSFEMDKIYLCYLFDVIRLFASDSSEKSFNKLEEIVDYMLNGYWVKNAVVAKLTGEKVVVFGRGLTMPVLYKDTIDWHYELASEKIIGTGMWEGLPIANSSYVIENDEGHKANYNFTQVVTAKGLQTEGRVMRHCVSSYADRCRNGNIGIFSMTRNDYVPDDVEDSFIVYKRLLTIQIDSSGNITQVRGLANRLAKPFEKRVIRVFAMDNMLKFRG